MADLKWLMDIDTKVRGSAADVLERIDKSLRGMDRDVKRTSGAFAKLAGAIGAVGSATRAGMNAAGGAVGGFARDALAHFTALATFGGLKTLAGAALDLGKNVLTGAAAAQRTDAVFRSLFGRDQGDRLLAFADSVAKSTEFDDDQLKSFIAGLGRAGFAADDMGKALAMAVDIAGLTEGDPVAALNQVGDALERLRLKGEVDFRILKSIGIGEPQFLADLSARTGKGIDKLKKELQAGKVDVDTLMAQLQASISSQTGGPSGAVGEERSKGLSAILNRLRNAPGNLFEEFRNSPAMAPLTASLAKFADALAPEGRIGGKIIAGIDTVAQKLAGWLEGFDPNAAMAKLSRLADDVMTVGRVIGTVIGGVATLFHALGTFWGEIAARVYLQVEGLMSFGTKLGDAIGSAQVWVVTGLDRIQLAVSGFFRKFRDAAAGLGSAVWQGLRDGIMGGIRAVGDAIENLGGGMLARLKGLLGIRSPSRVFEQLGIMSAEGFAQGLEGSQARLDATMGRSFEVPAPSRGFSGWSGGGQISVTVPITVNYTGGAGGASDADDIAQRVSELVPAQLRAALEDLRTELGGV